MSLPVALDTNVLVRLLVNDDPAQAEQAAALIDASAACFVPITVALELEWVLRGAYKLRRDAVIRAFEALLAIRHLHLEQADLVRQALKWHRQGMDFAAALHLARCEGCGALISFDRQLAQVAEQLNLQPTVQSPAPD